MAPTPPVEDPSSQKPMVVTLSSKGQLVIPSRFRRLLGLGPGSRLALRLCGDGLALGMDPGGKTGKAADVIGCSGYQGPALPLEAMDPARYARKD